MSILSPLQSFASVIPMAKKKNNAEKRRRQTAAYNGEIVDGARISQEQVEIPVVPIVKTANDMQPRGSGKAEHAAVQDAGAVGAAERASTPRTLEQVMSDWSGTGRGSHVELGPDETFPLEPCK